MVTCLRGSQFFTCYTVTCRFKITCKWPLSLYDSHGWMNQWPRDNCLFLTSNDTIANILSHHNVQRVFNSRSFLKHLTYVVTKLLGSNFATVKYPHVNYCSCKTTTPSLLIIRLNEPMTNTSFHWFIPMYVCPSNISFKKTPSHIVVCSLTCNMLLITNLWPPFQMSVTLMVANTTSNSNKIFSRPNTYSYVTSIRLYQTI